MRPIASPVIAIALLALAALPAAAEVPTAEDFAACNVKAGQEAAAEVSSASPRTEGAPSAGKLPPDARPVPQTAAPRGDVERVPPPAGKAGTSPTTRDKTGTSISSDKDPQVEGLAAERANDKAYVAAYRSCMRQRGF